MEVITEQLSANMVLRALTRLPDQLNRVYDSIFERIDHGPCAHILRSFIAMLTASKTTMTIAAWGHATAIDETVESPNDLQLKVMDVTHLAELSLGLVEIDGLGCVRLAHETVGDFVNHSTHALFAQRDKSLALASLRYLTLLSNVYGVHSGMDRYTELAKMLDDYPFSTYAALYWEFHASTTWDEELHDCSLAFLQDPTRSQVLAQIMFQADSRWDAEEGVNGLHLAAQGGLHSVVTHLLADGTDIEGRDCLGATALMYAADGGHCATVEVLLHSGADASAVCERGRTAVFLATWHNRPKIVTQLVNGGCVIAINACETTSNRSALVTAVQGGNLTVVKELLACPDLKINMPLTDGQGQTALHYATYYGFTEIVKILLAHPDILVDALNTYHLTAVIAAAKVGKPAILKLLLDQGAGLDLKDSLGGPAILRAIDNDHLDCVQILQARGADCSFVDTLGRNILHGCEINDRHEIMRYLLRNLQSLDPNAQDDQGHTPLHNAAGHDYDRCVRVLLDYGARTDILDNGGRSPVRDAKDSARSQCLPLLELARKIETENDGRDQYIRPERVNTLGPEYEMPIHSAIASLDEEALQKYLDTLGPKADVLITSRDIELGQTPPHTAASYGKSHAVLWLLDHGAEIDSQDLWNGTPLLRAAHNHEDNIVKLLLDRGASLNLPDKAHCTALDMVTDDHFNAEIASTLITRGATIGKQAYVLPKLLDWACEHGDLDLAKCLIGRGVSFQTKSAHDALTPHLRAQRAGQDKVAEYILAKTEEYRQSHNSKASRDRVPQLDRHTKQPSCIDDAVADTHSGGPVTVPDASAPVLTNNDIELPHETGETAMAESHIATARDSFRDVMADVSARERYLLAVVIFLLALLVAQWCGEV
jgi:ankyrin repeat protein